MNTIKEDGVYITKINKFLLVQSTRRRINMDMNTTTTMATTEMTTMATMPEVQVAQAQPATQMVEAQAQQPQVRTPEETVSKRHHMRALKKTKIAYGVGGAVAGTAGTLLITKGVPMLWRWGRTKMEAARIAREQRKAAVAQAPQAADPAQAQAAPQTVAQAQPQTATATAPQAQTTQP